MSQALFHAGGAVQLLVLQTAVDADLQPPTSSIITKLSHKHTTNAGHKFEFQKWKRKDSFIRQHSLSVMFLQNT